MNEELKNGDMVYVSHFPFDNETALVAVRRFIGMSDSKKFITETTTGNLYAWKYAKNVQEPKVVPWTFETCPLPPFIIQRKGYKNFILVVSASESRVYTDTMHTYNELLENYDYVVSREDIRPCGELQ